MLEFLQKQGANVELAELIVEVADACAKIAGIIVETSTGYAGSKNQFGEDQVAMDVASEKILEDHLKSCPFVGAVGSEELDEVKIFREDGMYSVFYDPLDGSSLIDVNFAVGTIVGIYPGTNVVGMTGREQVAALFAVYGPRTTIMVSTGNGVHEFIWKNGAWVLKKEFIRIGDTEKKYFSPGNLRVASENEDYSALVGEYIKEKYTLRYSGGMVPDINHILIKGHGIFSYPGSVKMPNGKLRLLFECAPMAFLMEQVGGSASDGETDILDVIILGMDQRTPIFIGTTEEVERCKAGLKRS